MRNFEERKAEVFHRSENRIKEKKRNRNRILVFCVPLFFVITLWSVMILPAMLPASKGDDRVEENENVVSSAGDVGADLLCVEIVNCTNDKSVRNEDVNKVIELHALLQSAFNSSETVDEETVDDFEEESVSMDETKDSCQSETTHSSFDYKIIFTDANGAQMVYFLSDEKLLNEATKKETVLTKEQYSNLLYALDFGVSGEGEK